MEKEYALDYAKFSLQGTHYDIGQSIGKNLPQYKELYIYTIMSDCIDNKSFMQKRELMDEFCPGIYDEISGLADSLSVPVGKINIFSDDNITVGACSQFVAMPEITTNGHILVGRSYEYSTDDELCLCITRANGKPAHIGFSILLFGRFDGINEYGLTVSMSSCEFGQKPNGNGFWFPLVLRSILDNCKNVNEAIYLLKKIPIRSNVNILLADKEENAVIVEIASLTDVKRISFRKNDKYLIATNHYMNEEMTEYDKHRGRHSVLRYNIIQKFFSENKGTVSVNNIKTILEQEIPGGVFCPYYEDYLGTLHSMVFDVSEIGVEICLGMPSNSKWERISFNSPIEISTKTEIVKNKHPENPSEFWSTLPPGSMET